MRRQQPIMTAVPGTIDPTINVNALVAQLDEKTEKLAEAERRYQNDMREKDNKHRDAMRDAETRRIDEKADQRSMYELRIDELISRSNEKALDLLAVGSEKALNIAVGQFGEFKKDITASLTDLQQKSWTTQGETKRGGDVWSKLSGLIALGISAITLAYLVFSKS